MDIYAQLRRDEGERQFPYTDSVGKLTIGVGHNLTDKGLTWVQIDSLLRDDVAEVVEKLQVMLPWFNALDDARKGVLINMGFNLGVSGLLQFHKALTAMEQGDWDGAANELRSSRWAGQVGARAGRLAQQLQSGEWI